MCEEERHACATGVERGVGVKVIVASEKQLAHGARLRHAAVRVDVAHVEQAVLSEVDSRQ